MRILTVLAILVLSACTTPPQKIRISRNLRQHYGAGPQQERIDR